MDNPLEVRFRELLIQKTMSKSLLFTKEQYNELISELKVAFISTTKSGHGGRDKMTRYLTN